MRSCEPILLSNQHKKSYIDANYIHEESYREDNVRFLVNACKIVVILGLAWRIVRYYMAFPLWGDEALVAIQYVHRSNYADLLRPLGNNQVAPIGFLWMTRAAMNMLGTSEYALHIFPLAVGVLTLPVFWWASRKLAGPLVGAVASAVLATAKDPERYAVELKPYGADIFAASLILGLTINIHQCSRRWQSWLLLWIATPTLMAFSYPSIFIFAASAFTIGIQAIRSKDRRMISLTFLYAALIGASFLFYRHVVAIGQYTQTHTFMMQYWAKSFMPHNLDALAWFCKALIPIMTSYSIGGTGGAIFTLILFLIGSIVLLIQKRWSLALLLLSPFAFNIAASFLQQYPFGGATRIAQFLAPAICLLAAIGIIAILEKLSITPRIRTIITFLAISAFGVITLSRIGNDIKSPYIEPYDFRVRSVMNAAIDESERTADSDGKLCVIGTPPPTAKWYLERRLGSINELADLNAIPHPAQMIHVICFDPAANDELEGYERINVQEMQLGTWRPGDMYVRLSTLRRQSRSTLSP